MNVLIEFVTSRWNKMAVLIFVMVVSGCGGSGSTGNTVSPANQRDAAYQDAFRVDSTEDEVDAVPGDLLCESEMGRCTLRAAVMEANASGVNAAGDRHTIIVPKGVYMLNIPNALGTSDLGLDAVLSLQIIESDATGSLRLSVPMNIYGAGARETVINAQQLDRVFDLGIGADSTLADMTITGGAGNTLGGGVYAQAHLKVLRVLITGNLAGGGAGIFVNPQGSLEMNDSTVSYNTADSQAGGIRIDTRGTITNSTISHNEALGTAAPVAEGTGVPFLFAQGGGVDIRGLNVIIRNSTIAFNRAADGGAGIHFDSAYFDALPDPITGAAEVPLFDLILENTIVANNSSDVPSADCLTTLGLSRILSQGNNLDSDDSCGLNQSSDLPGVNPMLADLEDYGGDTDTHALLPSSAARNAGNLGTCTMADQRGVGRGENGKCDIGAFEADF
ncbi:choice-of-anchor Q domain-containing protein [Zhongshania sp.]|jgi:CSLREA domain-containing protein|uniref:choice-of-anchor Q domain-containing protein n=1 Tax=Zhongshania sp. TaxID=1971902 RepID=UPI002A82B1CE|nr:choice-of-anchor Q domain-containing protein [Zhongshania sp.]